MEHFIYNNGLRGLPISRLGKRTRDEDLPAGTDDAGMQDGSAFAPGSGDLAACALGEENRGRREENMGGEEGMGGSVRETGSQTVRGGSGQLSRQECGRHLRYWLQCRS